MMTETSRRTLLFICPIMPLRSGNGLAMRAGLMLEGLARRFDVALLVVPVSGAGIVIPDFVKHLTVSVAVIDLENSIDTLAALIDRLIDPVERRHRRTAYPGPWASRFSGPAAARQAMAWLAGVRIEVLHVMRLYLAPLALRILRELPAPAPVALLDLDDDDARVHERLAELHALRGEFELAAASRAEVAKYAACAASVLRAFDVVLTSSEEDARRLALAHPGVRFEAVPNGHSADVARTCPGRVRARHHPVRLLFVANLGYLPNADAASQLIDVVMPALRQHGADVHLDIVGGGGSADLLQSRAAGDDRISVHGAVDEVAPWYAQADVAVVPLRAGGGTRIKILEAFAYGVPVVSSHLGAEGLRTVPGTHLLCADDAADFASTCLRVSNDPNLAAGLAGNAYELLRLHYTPERVHAKLDALTSSVLSGRE